MSLSISDKSRHLVIVVDSRSLSCVWPCNSMNHSKPGFPVLHNLSELAKTHVHWVSDAIQPSHPLYPLLLLPSILHSTKVFSNESVLCIQWPKLFWLISSKFTCFSLTQESSHTDFPGRFTASFLCLTLSYYLLSTHSSEISSWTTFMFRWWLYPLPPWEN